jgi:hypothetical protein
MSGAEIPRLNRKLPRPLYYINCAIIYLTTIPIHWLLTKTGRKAGVMPFLTKLAEGSKGGTRAFSGYTPTAQDVFVSTYVKSGTNWMMQLAHQIVFHGAGEFDNIHDVVAWPDMSGGLVKIIPLESQVVQQLSPEHKRVIKTHLAAQHVPYNEAAHYLTVIRDPKEVFVSSYHFNLGINGPLMPSLDVWFELFLTREFPMLPGTSWAEHTASWWRLREKGNVMVVLFDEMKKDLPGIAQRVAQCLGATLNKEAMDEVVKRCSFSYMSAIDDRFLPVAKENTPWGTKAKMVRAGQTGNSKELLTPEQQRRIDEHCKAELKSLGSDFPYDDYFNRAQRKVS